VKSHYAEISKICLMLPQNQTVIRSSEVV